MVYMVTKQSCGNYGNAADDSSLLLLTTRPQCNFNLLGMLANKSPSSRLHKVLGAKCKPALERALSSRLNLEVKEVLPCNCCKGFQANIHAVRPLLRKPQASSQVLLSWRPSCVAWIGCKLYNTWHFKILDKSTTFCMPLNQFRDIFVVSCSMAFWKSKLSPAQICTQVHIYLHPES